MEEAEEEEEVEEEEVECSGRDYRLSNRMEQHPILDLRPKLKKQRLSQLRLGNLCRQLMLRVLPVGGPCFAVELAISLVRLSFRRRLHVPEGLPSSEGTLRRKE